MGLQLGGYGFDANPILSERHWEEQQQRALEQDAYARNMAAANHTAQAGAANENFHQTQDALARHAAELAAQTAQHDQLFSRQGAWHDQEIGQQNAQAAALAKHHAAQLAFQQAEEDRRNKEFKARMEVHAADMAARQKAEQDKIDAAIGVKRQVGESKYQGDIDHTTRSILTDADRYGAPITSDEARAQAERDLQSHQFAPPNTDNGPLLPQFEKHPSDFQNAIPGPDTFPSEEPTSSTPLPQIPFKSNWQDVMKPSVPKWTGGPLTIPEPPVDQHAKINDARRQNLEDRKQERADKAEEQKRQHAGIEAVHDQTAEDRKRKHELEDLPYTDLKAQLDAEKDPVRKAQVLEATELSARGKLPSPEQFKSNGILADQYAEAKRIADAELAANREAFDAGHYIVKTPEQIWKAEHKKDNDTLKALLRVKNEKPATEETPRIGVRNDAAKVTKPAAAAAPVTSAPAKTTFGATSIPTITSPASPEFKALPLGAPFYTSTGELRHKTKG